MKMKYLLIIALMFITLLNVSEIYSQHDPANPLTPGSETSAILLGPVFGYNRSMHTADLASFAQEPLCPYFKNGEGNGFYFGLAYEHLLDDPVNSRHSLIGKIVYNYLPASLEVKTDDNYPSLVSDGKDGYTVVYTETNNTLEVDYSLVTAEVLYKFNPIENFGLGVFVGPTFDFALTKHMEQKLLLVGGDNVQFIKLSEQEQLDRFGRLIRYEDYDRTIVVNDDDIPDATGFRLGLKAGIQYAYNAIPRLVIIPQVAYNLGVTKLSSSEDWRVNAFQIGVDLRFSF